MNDAAVDNRLDTRISKLLTMMKRPLMYQPGDAANREEVLAQASTPDAIAREEAMKGLLDAMDNETLFPSDGLRITTQMVTSKPDGNTIKMQVIRPDTATQLPCVYYIHGGGMMALSAFMGNYRAWGKTIARQGLCVVMVDFRNSLRPSASEGVAPFPAGLNDCVSGYQWVTANAEHLGIDASQILISGESGGANLAIATVMRLIADKPPVMPAGLYALCPFIKGKWPDASLPSSAENEGLLISVANNFARLAYGIEAYEAKNPMAWPGFATTEDVAGFPPTMVSVNECDPLRDEGIWFYRLLQAAGVPSQCRQTMGTAHASELFGLIAPDLARTTARDMAGWIEECRLISQAAVN